MYFSKKNMEPVHEEETPVWMCSQPECPGWMRENFAFEDSPACPLCHSVMEQQTRMLPVLQNSSKR